MKKVPHLGTSTSKASKFYPSEYTQYIKMKIIQSNKLTMKPDTIFNEFWVLRNYITWNIYPPPSIIVKIYWIHQRLMVSLCSFVQNSRLPRSADLPCHALFPGGVSGLVAYSVQLRTASHGWLSNSLAVVSTRVGLLFYPGDRSARPVRQLCMNTQLPDQLSAISTEL